MFARTAWLAGVSSVVFAILFLGIGRSVAGLPAMRAAAAMMAEVIARDADAAGQSTEAPPSPRLRDEALAHTLMWRAFADALEEKLGPGTKLAVRADAQGAIVWVRVPSSGRWARWHTRLPSNGLRAGLLATLGAVAAAVLVGGVLLARQITGPLRTLAGIADRFAAGEQPEETPLRGPKEVRHVHEAFLRLRHALLGAEQEREAMLAGVSHDMRTPISRLRFALELYGEGASLRLQDEIGRELQELERAAARFVAYARANYEEPFGPIVLDALVSAAIQMSGAAEVVTFEAGAPRPVPIQSGNVQALVENLLQNAFRHGSAPFHVRTEQSADEVGLIVRDGGGGIPRACHDEALQPFVRLAEQDASGSGLGLAIVARVAKRHGGRVELRNGTGGFEVRVTLSGGQECR
jgi:two-component system osmolarity sensor histidine kinase EnvZ